MKEVLSKIIFGIVVVVFGYLVIANILHIIYLNSYESFDEVQEVIDNKIAPSLRDLNNNINHVELLSNKVLSEEDFNMVRENLELVMINIRDNNLFDYSTNSRIYLKDYANLTKWLNTNIGLNVATLRILEKYDDSISVYRASVLSNQISDIYKDEYIFREVFDAHKYQTIDFSIGKGYVVNNYRIMTMAVNLSDQIQSTKYLTELILKIEGEYDED